MPNRGTLNWSSSNTTYNIQPGYYSGGTLDSRTSYTNGYNSGYNKGKEEGGASINHGGTIYSGKVITLPDLIIQKSVTNGYSNSESSGYSEIFNITLPKSNPSKVILANPFTLSLGNSITTETYSQYWNDMSKGSPSFSYENSILPFIYTSNYNYDSSASNTYAYTYKSYYSIELSYSSSWRQIVSLGSGSYVRLEYMISGTTLSFRLNYKQCKNTSTPSRTHNDKIILYGKYEKRTSTGSPYGAGYISTYYPLQINVLCS